MCPWNYEVSWESEDGRLSRVVAKPGTPEFEDYWGTFLGDFASHLKAKGWLDNTYIALDERESKDVIAIVKFVRERAPALKIFLAANLPPAEIRDCRIDSYCYNLQRLELPDAVSYVSERVKEGLRTTYYVCCGPDCPNTFCSSAPGEAFWLGAYPAFSGFDGFLRWAWNCWPRNPMRDASFDGNAPGGWKAGDTFLVYPDGSPSRRFLELRNGIVAAEKVRLLKDQGVFVDEIKSLCGKFDVIEAMSNKTDFYALQLEVNKLVNR